MRLYDFSIYAQRRKEQQAASAVSSAVDNVNSPGGITVLKARVTDWLSLHQAIALKNA